MLRFVLFLSFVLGLYQTAAAGDVRIADGDCTALSTAVSAAAIQGGETAILLARGGHYNVCPMSVNTGSNIVIEGGGATLKVDQSQASVSSIAVQKDASLVIRNLGITWSGAPPVYTYTSTGCGMFGTIPCKNPPASTVSSAGALSLENVSIFDVNFVGALIVSKGTLTLRNVSIVNNTSTEGLIDASFAGGSQLDIDGGKAVEIYNSTIVNNKFGSGLISFLFPTKGMRFGNDIFANNTIPVCAAWTGQADSRGGNVFTENSCGTLGPGDQVVGDAKLGTFANHGGLVPTLQIGFGNPAYRAGVAQYCEATDARGVTRNAANCDAGAYESGGGLGLVTSNGMNGVYYVPGIANGHYVSVQRIHDNNDVMVFWDTFDSNGNPAWIFGVGTLTSDRHIHAAMSRNLGGVLQPGGPATGAKSSAWGTVDIDLTSCSAAQFSYQSSLPEFGSGQFPLTRLAFESAINCGD